MFDDGFNHVLHVPLIINKNDPELDEYKPYDLSDVFRITRKTEKELASIKNPETKIKHLQLALQKIERIINNSKLVFDKLNRERDILTPQDYWDALDQAENAKRGLEIKVEECQLEMSDQSAEVAVSIVPKITLEAPDPKTAPEPTPPDLMSIEDLAPYIKKSTSWIYKNYPSLGIPFAMIGNSPRFLKKDVDEWIEHNKK
jgi:predicted DNA-binding transcriptional regulator AlpA